MQPQYTLAGPGVSHAGIGFHMGIHMDNNHSYSHSNGYRLLQSIWNPKIKQDIVEHFYYILWVLDIEKT